MFFADGAPHFFAPRLVVRFGEGHVQRGALVRRGADDGIHLVGTFGLKQRPHLIREHVAIDEDGAPRRRNAGFGECIDEFLAIPCPQRRQGFRPFALHAQGFGQTQANVVPAAGEHARRRPRHFSARFGQGGVAVEAAARLGDGLVEQPRRQRRCGEVADADGTGGFAEDGHVVRVAAECRDVVLHPLQRRDLIVQPLVARSAVGGFRAERRVGEEAEQTQAVVDGHQHHAVPRQLLTIVEGCARRAHDEAAAVDPHHHWAPFVGLARASPHVEIEAVFVLWHRLAAVEALDGGRMRARRRLLRGVPLAFPSGRRHRRLPAQVAHWRRSVGDALEGKHGAVLGAAAAQHAGGRGDGFAERGGGSHGLFRRRWGRWLRGFFAAFRRTGGDAEAKNWKKG